MKHFLILLLLPILLISSKTEEHKYYHSLSEIIYDSDTKTFQVNMKVFFDDLQQAIVVEQNQVINDPIANYLDPINEYLDYHFSLKNAIGEKVPFKLTGHKDEVDEVWFYFESEPVEFSEKWIVQNSVFVNLYPSQINLVNFYPDKYDLTQVEGLLLNVKEKEGTILFNL